MSVLSSCHATEIDRVRKCSVAAVNYLLAHQEADGAWRDFQLWVGASGPWLTAVVGRALVEPRSSVSLSNDHPSMLRARDWLRKVEKLPQGGWGFAEDTHVDADSTAFVILFLSQWHNLDKKRLAELLRTFLKDTGGASCFRDFDTVPTAWKQSHPDVAAVVGAAFDRLDDKVNAEACKDYCLRCLETDGPVASHFWKSAVYTPAMTALLLSQTGDFRQGQFERIPFSFTSALEIALSLQLAVQAGSTFGLLTERLLDAQLEDGSWPASCQMSNPTIDQPWTQPDAVGSYTQRFADHKRLYATAQSLFALSYALKRLEGQSLV